MISQNIKNISIRIIIAVAFIVAFITKISAQNTSESDTIISFITIHPGSDIYELEGHNTIRINTPQYDVAINYGTFDFNAPNFVYRFVSGETDYFVSQASWTLFSEYYISSGRRIVEQQLALSPMEKRRLIELIAENLQPQNAVYRYNYVKDNCATRPLMMVNKAIQSCSDSKSTDSIKLGNATEPLNGPMSFRDVMTYYHANYPWYQFGIDLALGSGIDYEITNEEKTFAPVILEQQLANAKRTSDSTNIVEKTIVINDVAPDNAVLPPTPLLLRPVSVFSILIILTLAICILDIKRNKISRWYYTLIFTLLGIVGLILTFLIFISTHEATSPNFLYIFFNPLSLIVPLTIYIKKAHKILYIYFIFNALSIVCGAIAWPFLPQVINTATILIIISDFILTLTFLFIIRRK